MTYMIFEDNENVVSSLLLKKSLFGDYMLFSGGNSKLLRVYTRIRKLHGKNVKIFVFCDLSLDNRNTLTIFRDIVFALDNDKNAYVIPIICIEYFIVKLYSKFNMFNTYADDKKGIIKLATNSDFNGIIDYCKQNNINSTLQLFAFFE